MASIVGLTFRTLQQAIATRLDDDLWFDSIPILTQKYKNIPFLYEEALAKLGLVVVVTTPVMDSIRPNEPSVIADFIPISLIITENTLFNSSTKRADDTAQVALALLHNYPVPGCYDTWDGESQPLFTLTARRPTITVVIDEQEPTLLTYMVNMQIMGAWAYDGEASVVTTAQILTEAGIPIVTEGGETIITTQ